VTYRLRDEAIAEVREIAEYYRAIRPALAEDFATELARTIEEIVEFPKAWSRLHRGTRQRKIHRYPYLVIYLQEGGEETVVIVAVAHVKRRRRYWRRRLRGSR